MDVFEESGEPNKILLLGMSLKPKGKEQLELMESQRRGGERTVGVRGFKDTTRTTTVSTNLGSQGLKDGIDLGTLLMLSCVLDPHVESLLVAARSLSDSFTGFWDAVPLPTLITWWE